MPKAKIIKVSLELDVTNESDRYVNRLVHNLQIARDKAVKVSLGSVGHAGYGMSEITHHALIDNLVPPPAPRFTAEQQADVLGIWNLYLDRLVQAANLGAGDPAPTWAAFLIEQNRSVGYFNQADVELLQGAVDKEGLKWRLETEH